MIWKISVKDLFSTNAGLAAKKKMMKKNKSPLEIEFILVMNFSSSGSFLRILLVAAAAAECQKLMFHMSFFLVWKNSLFKQLLQNLFIFFKAKEEDLKWKERKRNLLGKNASPTKNFLLQKKKSLLKKGPKKNQNFFLMMEVGHDMIGWVAAVVGMMALY